MSPKSFLLRTTCVGAIMASATTGAAIAQEQDGDFALEEIIVTARLREESLQTTPLAITALTGDSLENRNVTDVRAMMDQVPGVYFTNQGGPGLGNVSMRGLTQGSLIGDEANVASFIDGFYMPGRIAFDGFLDGLERVEVVRGPQSALYGRNSFSGAINYISKKPDMKEMHGGVKATFGEMGRREYAGHLTAPLVEDKLAFRVDMSHMQTGGTHVNPVNNERLNDGESENIRAQLSFNPSDNVSMEYSYTYVDRNTTDQPLYGTTDTQRDGGYKWDFITFSYRNHKIQFPDTFTPETMDRHASDLIGSSYKLNRHTFRLDYEADKFTATAMIAHTSEDMRAISDATYGLGGDVILAQILTFVPQPAPGVPPFFIPPSFELATVDLDGNPFNGPSLFPVVGGQPIQDRKDFSGEIRFQSKGDGPMNWAFGGFFSRLKYDDKLETGYDVDAATAAAITAWVPGTPWSPFTGVGDMNVGLLPGTYDCDPLDFTMLHLCPTPGQPTMLDTWFVDGDSLPVLQDKYFENEEASIFASFGYDMSEKTRIQVEARYTWEKRYMQDRVEQVLYHNNTVADRNEKYSTFTPRIIIDHKLNYDTFLYAVVGKGAKAGGIQPSGGATYEPETNWTYEGGAKLTLLNGHMNLNLSAFYVDWNDMQLRFNNGLTSEVTNLGKAKVKGLEAMGAWRVHENVQFRFGWTYQDGEITEGNTSSAAGWCDIPNLEHHMVAVSATQAGITATTPGAAAACGLVMDGFGIPFVDTGSISVSTGNIAGNRMSNAPKHTIVYGVDVDIPVTDDINMFATADFNYRSQTFLDFENFIEIGSTTNVNAQIGFERNDVRLTFWVENLTKEDAPLAAIRNFNTFGQSSTGVQLREGRRFGATLSAKF